VALQPLVPAPPPVVTVTGAEKVLVLAAASRARTW
jgi:hypothetical protein